MIERTCQNKNCNKKFQAREADVKRGWAKCCSKACASHNREKKLDRNGYYDNSTQRREREDARSGEYFTGAHLFSNEEHDCNKQ